MKKTYSEWITGDYIFCLPANPKVDMTMIGSYRCNLKVHNGEVMLEAVIAEVFLRRGYKATDPMVFLLLSWILIYPKSWLS